MALITMPLALFILQDNPYIYWLLGITIYIGTILEFSKALLIKITNKNNKN